MSADYVSKLASLLSATYTVADKALRGQAESALHEAAQDIVGFTQAMLVIIQTQPLDVANAAGASLSNQIATAQNEGRLLGEVRLNLGLLLGQVLVESQFDSSIKTRIAESLGGLISSDLSDPQTFLPKQIQPIVHKALQGDVGSIIGGLKILRPMFQTLMDTSDFSHENYLQMIISIAFNAVQQVLSATKEAAESQLNDAVTILFEISCCLQGLVEYSDVTSMKSMGMMIQYLPATEAMVQTLLLRLPEPGNPSYSSIVNVSPNPILTQMNQAKSYMLDCLIHLINFIIDFPDQKTFSKEESDSFWHIVHPLLDPIQTAVLELSSSPLLKDFMSLEYVSDFMTKALDFLATITREPMLAPFFLPRAKTLVVDSVMILMGANQSEYLEFEDSPESFLTFATDTCEKQESQTVKTSAASLLDNLCAHIDGCLTFTVRLCCQFICHISLGDDANNYVNIAELTESNFYKQSQETQVETCLMILSLLGKYICKRIDLQNALDMMLQTTRTSLLASVHPFILCRLCTFIYYNAEHLVREYDDLFDQLIMILMRSIQLSAVAPATAAADCLSYLLKDEAVSHRLQIMLGEIVQVLIDIILKTSVKGIFDALEEIALNFVDDLVPYTEALLNALVQRILTEQFKLIKFHTKESIYLIKSWNIVRILADSVQMAGKLDAFEHVLLPLITTIKDVRAINFEEDLVLLLHILITKRQAVSQVCWDAFLYLPDVQSKFKDVFFQMFELLNAYIHYGRHKLIDSPDYVELLVHMCETCLFSSYSYKSNESMASEGAVMMQLMLQELPGAMDAVLERVIEKCMDRYSRTIVHEFFRVRLLGVILSAFVYNAHLTQQILARRSIGEASWLSFMLLQIVTYRSHFNHRYDRKLAVLGLCTLISHPILENDVVIRLPTLFETIVAVCSMSIRKPKTTQDMDIDIEISRKKKKKKTQRVKEQQEANYKMSSMITQVNDFDELEFFKQMLKTISNSPAGLKLLVANMKPELLEDLELLVKSKTVTTNVLGGSVVRKVIKAKHVI
mmetsp:Transcript_20231/g.37731  ORF Transcript_20231/g.37731 Transcript_20231/m.37731 type:complete len:1027 (-) Transcript_20231:5-3085(-)